MHLLYWTACDGNNTFPHRFLLLQSFASCFLFAGFRDNRNLEAKDSLTDSGCLHDRAQAMVMDPAAPTRKSTIISVYGPVLQCCRIGECAGGGRWHAAVGTVGGNCFPGICQPRVTLAISWSRNALHLLSVDLATLYTWYWWSLQRFTLAICKSRNALHLVSADLAKLYTCYLLAETIVIILICKPMYFCWCWQYLDPYAYTAACLKVPSYQIRLRCFSFFKMFFTLLLLSELKFCR